MAVFFILSLAAAFAVLTITNDSGLYYPHPPESLGYNDNPGINSISYLPVSLSSGDYECFEKYDLCNQRVLVYETDRVGNADDFANLYYRVGRFSNNGDRRLMSMSTGIWMDEYGYFRRIVAFFHNGKIFHISQSVHSDRDVDVNEAERRFNASVEGFSPDDYFEYKKEQRKVAAYKRSLEPKVDWCIRAELFFLLAFVISAFINPAKTNMKARSVAIYILVCAVVSALIFHAFAVYDLSMNHYYGSDYHFDCGAQIDVFVAIFVAALYAALLLWMWHASRKPYMKYWLIPDYLRFQNGEVQKWNRLQFTLVYWPMVYIVPIPLLGMVVFCGWVAPGMIILLIILLVLWITKGKGDYTADESAPESADEVPQDVFFCRFCGKDVPSDSVFCPRCGKRIG